MPVSAGPGMTPARAEPVRLRPWIRGAAAVVGLLAVVAAPWSVADGDWTGGVCAIVVAILAFHGAVTGRSARVRW